MAYTAKQNLLIRALLAIDAKTGAWEKGDGPDGAAYTSAQYNAAKASGHACQNCAFFKAPTGCAIVRGQIEREGICRLNVISSEKLTKKPQPIAGVPRRRIDGETL